MTGNDDKSVADQRGEVVTRSHRETIIDRMQRDREFCAALLDEHHRELRMLRDALAPFALMCESKVRDYHPDGDGCEIVMSNREMRRARDALS